MEARIGKEIFKKKYKLRVKYRYQQVVDIDNMLNYVNYKSVSLAAQINLMDNVFQLKDYSNLKFKDS